ncbi:MAG: hypothetical protein HRT72_03820 [Flavobacteriales bacterium]|nr:hypothetical protein [Flavobacteriales bacterium]
MITDTQPNPLIKQIGWLILFSIAMGFLESSVVVYLRELYYPNGFDFPLEPIDKEIAFTEFWREVATIVMLAGISILSGTSKTQRFAFFLISFAIWDIFYYVFLYILLAWPSTLMTWDILFLIPVPWVGPVVTPVIISLLMIGLGSSLIYHNAGGMNWKEWSYSIVGSLIVVFSWTLDYFTFITRKGSNQGLWTLSSEHDLFDSTAKYIPQDFNWYIFLFGITFLLFAIYSYNRRCLTQRV